MLRLESDPLRTAMSLDDMMMAVMKLYRQVLDGIDPPACRIFHPTCQM